MKNYLIICGALFVITGVPVWAEEVNTDKAKLETLDFDARHKACLEQIAQDEELALEEAMIWQSQGGGRRARHCVAMALSASGHPDEGALRLEKLAKAPDGGSPPMRAGFYVEAADLWLEAQQPRKAIETATVGLKIAAAHIDLYIVRARAYAALERWDFAETDLSSALAYVPDDPRALRYRADARLQKGKLDLAQADIHKAVALDGENIDILLVRGKIIEAIRLETLKTK
ncbi:MAG: hypothetical protein COA69_07195 [Robiginitomaculum sp.]|nr:MAG: hypothetical protein COA69_07195 [Robiginitomaculum sp.]